jgi:translocation and assembly module TamB
MTRRPWLLWLVVAGLVLLLGSVLTLRWASRSEAVLRWGVLQLAGRLPCRLDVHGLSGSLTEPVHIERVRCESDTLLVEARQVRLDWSPWALKDERLEIETLAGDRLQIVPRGPPAGGPQPPATLRPPLAIHVGRLALREVQIGEASDPVVLRDLALSYDSDGGGHRLRLESLEVRETRISGTARIAAERPFALQARLQFESSAIAGWPISLVANLSGDLLRTQAGFSARVHDLPMTGEAVLAAFETDPVQALRVHVPRLDLAALRADLPATAVEIELESSAVGVERLQGTVRASNAAPGTLDQRRLPLRAVRARFSADRSGVFLRDLDAELGAAGRVRGEATLTRALLQASLTTTGLDLHAIHGRLRTTELSGEVRLTSDAGTQRAQLRIAQGGLRLQGEFIREGDRLTARQATLEAQGARLDAQGELGLTDALPFTARGRLTGFDPARFGDFPAARLNGEVQANGRLRPEWVAAVRYTLARSRFRDLPLAGRGELTLTAQRVSDAAVELRLGRNALQARGAFGAAGDRLGWSIDALDLVALEPSLSGTLSAQGWLAGTRASPSLAFEAQARAIAYGKQLRVARVAARGALRAAADPAIELKATASGLSRGGFGLDMAKLAISGTVDRHQISASATSAALALTAQLDGGLDRARGRWAGSVQQLAATGTPAFELIAPVGVVVGRDEFTLGAAKLRLAGGIASIGETRSEGGRISTSGSFAGARLSSLLSLFGQQPPFENDIRLAGSWNLRADRSVNGELQIARERGDIVLPGKPPVALGLTDLGLELRAKDDQVDGVLRARAGPNSVLQVRAQSRAESREGKWGVSSKAPLRLTGTVNIRSLRPILALFSRRATGDGQLALRLSADGTLGDPRLRAELEGSGLRVEHVERGVFLRDGTLQAALADGVIELTSFAIRGGAGTLSARGKLATARDQPTLAVQWHADKLAAVQHPDLRLTLSGQGTLSFENRLATLRGALTADQGRVELRADTAPRLDDDVVVAGADTDDTAGAPKVRAALALELDLGRDFLITGRGLEAALVGAVALRRNGDTPLVANGRIEAAKGTYSAYGQRLTIERGNLVFAGPVDNPGLDIRALRKNLRVEAGVEVSGTVRNPRVRLVSVPEVPDVEKISWLVLGRGIDSSNSGDVAKLQASAMAFAAGVGTAPLQQQVARAIGLDEIRYTASAGSSAGAVAVGKRINDRIYVTFEQNLSEAGNKLWVSYQLTRRWSVRTESGKSDAVDLFYTWSFD